MAREISIGRLRNVLKRVEGGDQYYLGTFETVELLLQTFPEWKNGKTPPVGGKICDSNSWAYVGKDATYDTYKFNEKGKWKKVSNGGGGGTSDHEALSGIQGGNDGEHYHLAKSQMDLVVNNKGYFTSEQQLNETYPSNSPLLKGGEFAFVDDPDVGLYLFVFTPVRKVWVRDASVNWISRNELESGVMLKSYATLEPKQGDIRFVKSGHKTIVESYDANDWKTVTTIGSVTTDTFNMESDEDGSMVGFNDIYQGKYSSLIKRRLSEAGQDSLSNEYGSLERQTILSSKASVLQSTSTGGRQVVVSTGQTKEYGVGVHKFNFRAINNIEFATAEFIVKTPTKARMWIVEEKSGIAVYESQTRRDAIDSNGTLIIDDKTQATMGSITATFPRLGSLMANKDYIISMEIFEGVMLGNDNFISFTINGQGWQDSPLVTSKEMEDRLTTDIYMADGMSYRLSEPLREGETFPVSRCMAEMNNRYGIVYGDEEKPITFRSNSKPKLFNSNDPKRTNYIASEAYARSVGSLDKVFHIDEMEYDQVALMIQTEPKTFTKWDDEQYLDYDQAEYLTNVRMNFKINSDFYEQFLFGDTEENKCVLEIDNNVCMLKVSYYNTVGEVVTDSIDLFGFQDVPEGHAYPKNRYTPERDMRLESTKTWKFSADVYGKFVQFTLEDPNGGNWSIVKPDDGSCLCVGHHFRVGESYHGDRLRQLWDTFVTMKSSLGDDAQVFEVDRYTVGISRARLVMNFNGVPVDILDPIAVHKYADMTKDFHTFFEPKTSGLYRCFQMDYNLPEGYIKSDNDFYVNVYTTSQNYKCLEALDIRSGRKHIKTMYNGKWLPWVETGGTKSVPLVPKRVYLVSNTPKNSVEILSLSNLGIVEGDELMVSCGTRGLAVKVDKLSDITNYACAYHLDFEEGVMRYWVTQEGVTRCSFEIFKYSPVVAKPPEPWVPYLKLKDVITDLYNNTKDGDIFYADVMPISWELVHDPRIIIDLPFTSEIMPLVFDDKGKYFFRFPINIDGVLDSDSQVTYRLEWNDQFNNTHVGEEAVTKNVVVVPV